MHVILSSKNIPLTEGLKTFITSRIDKLKKYSPQQLQQLEVVVDVDRKKHAKNEEAVVEIVGQIKGKPLAAKQSAPTFYKAFFGAVAKMRSEITKAKEKKAS